MLCVSGLLRAEDDGETIQDPDMISEVSKIEAANVDNETSKADQEGTKTLGLIFALVQTSRVQAAAFQSDFHDRLSEIQNAAGEDFLGEEDDSALASAVESLGNKAGLLEGKARMASLKPPKMDEKSSALKRAAYRAADRERDLKRGELYLRKADQHAKKKSPVKLTSEQTGFISDLRDYAADLKSVRSLMAQTIRHLEFVPEAPKQVAEILAKLKSRAQQIDLDIRDLDREIRVLETNLTMQLIEEAAWHR